MKAMMIYITLVVILLINSGCPKPCIEANYSFAVYSEFLPALDSIKVGDTIFLTSTFPAKLTDVVSGASIDYSNSTNIGSTLGIIKLIKGTIPEQEDAVNNFNFISITGRIYNDNSIPSPNKFQQLSYKEVDNYYKLKIGIIPKERGLYYLGVTDGLSNARNNSHSCEKAAFSIKLNNTNQHLNYFLEWNSNINLSEYEQPRAYFLKVY